MPVRAMTPDLIAHYEALGLWGQRALHEYVDERAETDPEHLAVVDQHERLTYREFVRRTHNVAAWLGAQGLEPGTPIAIQSTNRNALAIMHMACDRADLTFLPLSSAYRERELRHLLRLARAAFLFVPEATAEHDYRAVIDGIRGDLPDLVKVGVIEGGAGDMDLSAIATSGDATVALDRNPNIPRFIMVTSGTTDLPKLSLWSDNNLWSFMQHYRESVAMTAADVSVGLAPANTGATGYVFPVLAPLLSGATSVLQEHWSPADALDLIERERATIAVAIPTQILKLLQEEVASRDFSSMRVFTNAGAAMPPDGARQMEAVFGCTGQVVYGASDGGVPFMTTIADPAEKRWTSVGRPAPFCEIRLLTPIRENVAEGESGEIAWRSATKSFGYLNDPELTEAAWFEDGWYVSGDLGAFDADGYLSIIGRAKDMIIRGGQNISPRELEDVISQHPAVAEVSVVGIPDPMYGERACACLLLKKGASVTPDEIRDFMFAQGMAKYKLPELVEFFDEFPSSTGGKVTKAELRRLVQDRIVEG